MDPHRFDWARLWGTITFVLCTLLIFVSFICFCFRQRHRNRIQTERTNPSSTIQRYHPPVYSSESAPPPYHSRLDTPPPPPYNSKMELNL